MIRRKGLSAAPPPKYASRINLVGSRMLGSVHDSQTLHDVERLANYWENQAARLTKKSSHARRQAGRCRELASKLRNEMREQPLADLRA